MDNKTALLILMIVLIVFVVLLTVLGIVFIIALRKRRPVVKVLMPTLTSQPDEPEEVVLDGGPVAADSTQIGEGGEPQVPEMEPGDEDDDDDDEASNYVTEGSERVRYNRSFTAKLCQLSNESKEWYTTIKNELLSYERVKDRMSWKRESFRIGRTVIARLVIRGKTLCMLIAVEPESYNGTKFSVEDVSNVASTVDTPTLFRIKSAKRLKLAVELLAGMMKEIKAFKNPRYEAKDYFVAYEGDMALMQRGLVKRMVSGTTRTFKIEEIDKEFLQLQDQVRAQQHEQQEQTKEAPGEEQPEAAATTDAKPPVQRTRKPKAPAAEQKQEEPASGETAPTAQKPEGAPTGETPEEPASAEKPAAKKPGGTKK